MDLQSWINDGQSMLLSLFSKTLQPCGLGKLLIDFDLFFCSLALYAGLKTHIHLS